MGREWLRVPVGPEAARWSTRTAARRVLAVVHNVTSLTRLLDALSALDGDPRIQVVFTWTRSSPFTHDVEGFLADLGVMAVPWEQAISVEFELAVSASYGGELHRIKAPLVTISHGMGYNRVLESGVRSPETGDRRPETGDRRPETGDRRPVFGLSPEWLLHDGRPVPASIVLSHPDQRERLARDCPQAVPVATVAGDPCFDRMLAGAPHRRRYRRAFGAAPSRRLVLVSSTWAPHSLLAEHPGLLSRLLAELPMDEYQVAAALHPNIWHGHGPWQVRTWLADALRAGLILLPPRDGWRAALLASDLVIGDHGSVTFYGAALGRPVLLGAFSGGAIDPSSPIGALGRTAPRLDPGRPLLPQLDAAVTAHTPSRYAHITERTTAAPGRSLRLLRTELYRLMDLDEPAAPPAVLRVPEPDLGDRPGTAAVTATLTSVAWHGATALLDRRPAAVTLHRPGGTDGRHLSVDHDEPEERLLGLADVIHRRSLDTTATAWLDETLETYPGCQVAAAGQAPGECVIGVRDEGTVHCHTADPALAASAVHGWLATGRPLKELPAHCTVRTGATRHRLHFTPAR